MLLISPVRLIVMVYGAGWETAVIDIAAGFLAYHLLLIARGMTTYDTYLKRQNAKAAAAASQRSQRCSTRALSWCIDEPLRVCHNASAV